MIRFEPCTENDIALAKSLTDSEIDALIEQIFRHERPQDDYWGIMYVRDLWALGIEPKIAPGRKIAISFGQAYAAVAQDWKSRKSGQHVPYFGEEAEIAEYKLANHNKKTEIQPEKNITDSKSRHPKPSS